MAADPEPFTPDTPDELAGLHGAAEDGTIAAGPPLITPNGPPPPPPDELPEPEPAPRAARDAGITPYRRLERVDRGIGAISHDLEQITAQLARLERGLVITTGACLLVALAVLALLKTSRAPGLETPPL